MESLNLKATHAPVKKYYEALGQFEKLGVTHETAVRSAFQELLNHCARLLRWTLVPEFSFEGKDGSRRSADAVLLDGSNLQRGMWEAKDEADLSLRAEAKKKFAVGYPSANFLIQSPERAVLYRYGQASDFDLTKPQELVLCVTTFCDFAPKTILEWEKASLEFKTIIPELATKLLKLIEDERQSNKPFIAAFDSFLTLCRQSINPDLSPETVETMLIQHLLTQRIFERVFRADQFTQRNVIAIEIEKVIRALTSRKFNKEQFLGNLEYFYRALEKAAEDVEDYQQKQNFLNTVYERFFQGFSKKEADTHGIVYTPQPIVDFMVRSVEEILKKEFGRSLSDEGVHILDPFVGTGNFITRIMQEIRPSSLPRKYKSELHCNEVMLLPYYIACMNIEHAYMDKTNQYEPFDGICLVDTFELAEATQVSLFSEENSERVKRQNKTPLTVVLGNPPYNMGQTDESEQNKNRSYKKMDERIRETYVAGSTATLLNKLWDPYVRAFRWASDRLSSPGIIAFVSNSSFVDQIAFDGMRKCLLSDFDAIYVLDLGGNVRKNPRLSGTTHNVFGIQVGVSINILVRQSRRSDIAELFYFSTDEFARREMKLALLESYGDFRNVPWQSISSDSRGRWLHASEDSSFQEFIPIGDHLVKNGDSEKAVFRMFSLGVVTNRDAYTYNFAKPALSAAADRFISIYSHTLHLASDARIKNEAYFIDEEDSEIKWTRQVKASLSRGQTSAFGEYHLRESLYRPFCSQWLYYDNFWNEEQYQTRKLFPLEESYNRVICLSAIGDAKPFQALAADSLPNLHLTGDSQCFAYYVYDEVGQNRRENITDWALEQFRSHYGDAAITKWDIFHYVYAVLHHPEYRERYGANLKRELPRIPFVGGVIAKQAKREVLRSAQDDNLVQDDNLAQDDNLYTRDDNSIDEEGQAGEPAHTGDEWSTEETGGTPVPTTGKMPVPQNADEGVRATAGGGAGATEASGKMPDGTTGGTPVPQDAVALRAIAREGAGTPQADEGDRETAGGGAGATAASGRMPDATTGGTPVPLSAGAPSLFWRMVEAGRRLAEIHVRYEEQAEYPLEMVEREPFSWRVEKMKLSKDKTTLIYNESLTLKGIPAEVFEYRLGNRSALEWVLDQYQVSTDKRSGIVNDPNREDDPEYIARLVKQVVTVSLETVAIVKGMPGMGLGEVAGIRGEGQGTRE